MTRRNDRVRRHDERLLRQEDYLRRNRRASMMILIPLLVILAPYVLARLLIHSYVLLNQVPPPGLVRSLAIVLQVYARTIPPVYALKFFIGAGVAAFIFFILAYEAHLKIRHIESIRLYRRAETGPAEGEEEEDSDVHVPLV